MQSLSNITFKATNYQTQQVPKAKYTQLQLGTDNFAKEQQEKEAKKEKRDKMISFAAIGTFVAFAAMAIIQALTHSHNTKLLDAQRRVAEAQERMILKEMGEKFDKSGSNLDSPGAFDMSRLDFKNLSNDESIFDIRKSKSLHEKVKSFFVDLLDKGQISEDIAKRAGILGEGGTNSILLLGGSGVGKTEVIKAYAKEADAEYVAIKMSDFANSYVNGTSNNITEMIKALIERAKRTPDKQLVISLDEVDALVKVTNHDTSGEISKNRQSLLTGMDELLQLPNIRLFTSSNANVTDLDSAFLRRCGYNFEVPMPDKDQLLEALKFQMRKCEGAFDNNGEFFNIESNADLREFLDKLVERRCAFGDVKNICKAAKDSYALDMFKNNTPNATFKVEYLSEALEKIETTAGEIAEMTGSII